MRADLVGVVCNFTEALKKAKIGVYVVSTWCVYMLVYGKALSCLSTLQEHRLDPHSCGEIPRGSGSIEERRLEIQRVDWPSGR